MTRPIERDDEALDAAQARVVQRMRRLMVLSTLIMVGGFLVVFGVIGYRLFTAAEKAARVEATVALPQGARVLSTAVADGRLVVTYEAAGATEVRIFDLATLQLRGQLTLRGAP